ncbi:MAG TPA: hypothetical protein DCX07_03660 [Phycisphaerales bacterium]|nr:hypothetical protein [Phycisphaerales bacterium]
MFPAVFFGMYRSTPLWPGTLAIPTIRSSYCVRTYGPIRSVFRSDPGTTTLPAFLFVFLPAILSISFRGKSPPPMKTHIGAAP